MIGRHHHRPEFTQRAHPGHAQRHRQSQARERKAEPRQKTAQGRWPSSAACFSSMAGTASKAATPQHVISDAHVDLGDDESEGAVGGADAELRHPPAEGRGRPEGDGKQDADGQGRQERSHLKTGLGHQKHSRTERRTT